MEASVLESTGMSTHINECMNTPFLFHVPKAIDSGDFVQRQFTAAEILRPPHLIPTWIQLATSPPPNYMPCIQDLIILSGIQVPIPYRSHVERHLVSAVYIVSTEEEGGDDDDANMISRYISQFRQWLSNRLDMLQRAIACYELWNICIGNKQVPFILYGLVEFFRKNIAIDETLQVMLTHRYADFCMALCICKFKLAYRPFNRTTYTGAKDNRIVCYRKRVKFKSFIFPDMNVLQPVFHVFACINVLKQFGKVHKKECTAIEDGGSTIDCVPTLCTWLKDRADFLDPTVYSMVLEMIEKHSNVRFTRYLIKLLCCRH